MNSGLGTLGRCGIAIHGGAGTLERAAMSKAAESRYSAVLQRALAAGYDILRGGGASLDAVTAAVMVMEDSPLFNAGRGAVFNAEGAHELDAAIMDGKTLKAGAVAAIRTARNPVLVARAVMEHTGHVMLAGAGADRFARRQGFAAMPQKYFHTERRRRALANERERMGRRGPTVAADADRHGTVGAVALDRAGNLAAATSTGGYTNKMAGRVGDSPIVGAGVYADNATCAISATGSGEHFMRAVLAHDIAARAERVRGG